jgi:hypothetical protein
MEKRALYVSAVSPYVKNGIEFEGLESVVLEDLPYELAEQKARLYQAILGKTSALNQQFGLHAGSPDYDLAFEENITPLYEQYNEISKRALTVFSIPLPIGTHKQGDFHSAKEYGCSEIGPAQQAL